MATTSEADAREVIRRYFNGVNNEDWDDFGRIWHDDVVVDVTGGLHFEGREDTLAYYPRVLKNFPVHHDDPYAVHVAGDIVTVEIAFTGETLEGVKAGWEAVDVFTLEKGKIKKLTTWYDMGHVVNLLRTPGLPEKRLATLVADVLGASAFYKRRFAELGLDAGAVAADLTLLPVTTAADVAAAPAEFACAAPRDVRQILVTGDGVPVPVTRGDMEDAAWLLSRALVLQHVAREDVILPLAPHPALADACLRLRAHLVPVSGVDPAAARRLGATVVLAPDAASAERYGTVEGARTLVLDEIACETPLTGVFAAAFPRAEGLEVFDDAHVVEIVDGELVVTPLGRRGLPVLRYATGYRATWAESAPGEPRRIVLG